MSVIQVILLLFVVCDCAPGSYAIPETDLEGEARQLLERLDIRGSQECYKTVIADWNYQTNITNENKEKKLAAYLEFAKWERMQWEQVQEWKDRWPQLKGKMLKRQFKKLSILGSAALNEIDLTEYEKLVANMTEVYSTAKLCHFSQRDRCDLPLQPDIKRLMATSRNRAELEYLWLEWRRNLGRDMRPDYRKFVKLANKAAKLNGFDDMGKMWLEPYDSPTFLQDVDVLWKQLEPLYKQLHAYVRRKLREYYSPDVMSARGPIPAQLLGNMWAQSWSKINDLLVPYPNKTSTNADLKGYTPKRMFELAEEFFISLNLSRTPEEFWQHSMFEDPGDREVVCPPSAWDFCNGIDFRIKQCTAVDMEDLVTVHHEMGHIQYYLQYKHLPKVFRDGANPGFHEAVGDAVMLSVVTPKHLHKIGLLSHLQEESEADINFLMKMALDRVTFLPFSIVLDRWRWDVFSGKTGEKDWNCAWWDLRYEVQGIKPPNLRTESNFDPGSKFHVPASVPYIRYFVSFILHFQFHKSLCLLADQYDPQDPAKPLHKCDIYQSTVAGKALGNMLKLGASKPWPEILKVLTGTERIDATAMLDYFRPLEAWLREDNLHHGVFVGWEKDGVYCTREGPATPAGKRLSSLAPKILPAGTLLISLALILSL